jgi:hypothetical protein
MKDTFRDLLLSDESHPVDFDRAWRWLKYASEDSAKARLTETSIARETQTIEGRHSLTIDGFRLLCFGGADDPSHARAVGLQLQQVADELHNERLTSHKAGQVKKSNRQVANPNNQVEKPKTAQVPASGERGKPPIQVRMDWSYRDQLTTTISTILITYYFSTPISVYT